MGEAVAAFHGEMERRLKGEGEAGFAAKVPSANMLSGAPSPLSMARRCLGMRCASG